MSYQSSRRKTLDQTRGVIEHQSIYLRHPVQAEDRYCEMDALLGQQTIVE
jgi:hypothetical protein